MLIDAGTLAVFVPAVVVLALTPGPDLVFISASAISSGRRGGVAAALGCTSGAFTHAILAALGLTTLVAAWRPAYEVLRLGGAAYLAYLGVRALRAKGSTLEIGAPAAPLTPWRLYRDGLVNNLMNPKAILFSLTFLPQFASPERGPIWAQVVLLGAVLSVVMLAIVIPIAVTSGLLGRCLARRAGAARTLNRTTGAIFLALAVWVFRSRRLAAPQ
jgi:threonine/homoserine/homoserine lactone efflux protein